MKTKSCATCKYNGAFPMTPCRDCRNESLWEESEFFFMGQSPIWGGVTGENVVSEPLNPLEVQAGGTHYKGLSIQPAEYISKNNLEWCAGNIVKYVTRHKDKGGFEDIKKARHYLDLLVAFYYPGERLE